MSHSKIIHSKRGSNISRCELSQRYVLTW